RAAPWSTAPARLSRRKGRSGSNRSCARAPRSSVAQLSRASSARRRTGSRPRAICAPFPAILPNMTASMASTAPASSSAADPPAPAWFPSGAGPEWLAAWHGFGWLADLVSAGEAAREAARALIQSWLDTRPTRHPIGWRPDVLGTRISAWLMHLDELAGRDID